MISMFELEEGMTLAEIEAALANHNMVYRVRSVNGKPTIGTSDYREDRVNIAIADGKLVRVIGIG